MKRINIMFDAERMKHPYTGLYFFCLNLGRALQKHFRQDELSFYAPADALSSFGENPNSVKQSSLHKFYLPVPNNIGIWHCTYQSSLYFPFRKKIKVLLTIHDLNFMYDDKKSPKKKEEYRKMIMNRINRADHVVCISNFVKHDLERLDMCPHGKIFSVIYNGNNELKPIPDFHQVVYRPQKSFIFTVGTIARKKNFHILPAAMKYLPYHLVIAGKIEDEKYLQEIMTEIKRHHVEDKISLIYDMSETDKSWYYQHCEAFIFPSLSEGFGFPPIEAMSFGKPVILSTKTSLPEIGGEVAYYLENFDSSHIAKKINNAIEDVREKQLQDAIKKQSQKFTWEKAANEYVNIYRSLL